MFEWKGFPEDHPRMRGEKIDMLLSPSTDTGSSPHARGKVHNICMSDHIPQDHPRMRGEKCGSFLLNFPDSGSSPHARGKGIRIIHVVWFYRIIPACAGKRTDMESNMKAKRDHPRMRGEKGSRTRKSRK